MIAPPSLSEKFVSNTPYVGFCPHKKTPAIIDKTSASPAPRAKFLPRDDWKNPIKALGAGEFVAIYSILVRYIS